MAIITKRSKSCTYTYDDEIFTIKTIQGRSRLVYIGTETDGAKIKIPDGITDISFMFSRTAVKSVPKIPASVIYAECAFYKCTQLKTAQVHAPGLKYAQRMFFGCRSLIWASMKDTPNIIDADSAFGRCDSLEEFKAWPKMLENGQSMFAGCTRLSELPSFKGTALTNTIKMCMGCSSLYVVTGAPENLRYAKEMFRESALIKAMDLSACNKLEDISGIYNGCAFLRWPGKLPPNITTAEYAYKDTAITCTPDLSACMELANAKGMFKNCLNLKKSSKLPVSLEHAASMYEGCRALTTQPDISCTVIENMTSMFERTAITHPRSLPKWVIDASSAYANTPIQIVPPNFSDHPTLSDAAAMFKECKNLQGIPDYPKKLSRASEMCQGCINLKQIGPLDKCADIENTYGMFQGCTGLDSSGLPDLMADTLDRIQNYGLMFQGTPHPGLKWNDDDDSSVKLDILYGGNGRIDLVDT